MSGAYLMAEGVKLDLKGDFDSGIIIMRLAE